MGEVNGDAPFPPGDPVIAFGFRPPEVAAWRAALASTGSNDRNPALLDHRSLRRAGLDRPGLAAERFGPGLRVVVALRAPATTLADRWERHVRHQRVAPFPDWLRTVLERDGAAALWVGDRPETIIDTWGPVIGEDHLTFLAEDPHARFTRLLGLAEDPTPGPGRLSHPQLEMLRRFNERYQREGTRRLDWAGTATAAALTPTAAGASSPPGLPLPGWAGDRVGSLTAASLERIRSSDCRVVGDLDRLVPQPAATGAADVPPDTISTVDAGIVAFDLYDAGRAYGTELPVLDPRRVARRRLASAPVGELVGELARRTRGRARGRRLR